jgi:hypothetical protein
MPFFTSLWEYIQGALNSDPESVFQVLACLVVSFMGGFASESNAITNVKDIFASLAKVIFVGLMACFFVSSIEWIDWTYKIIIAGFIGLAGIPGVIWIAKFFITSIIKPFVTKIDKLDIGGIIEGKNNDKS